MKREMIKINVYENNQHIFQNECAENAIIDVHRTSTW